MVIVHTIPLLLLLLSHVLTAATVTNIHSIVSNMFCSSSLCALRQICHPTDVDIGIVVTADVEVDTSVAIAGMLMILIVL